MPPSAVEDGAVAELRERLRRYDADRHPLKHATAQFHLGTVLLAREELAEAETAFATAAALFRVRGARPEEAKALNGLGATLRAAGRLELAARALTHAAAGLGAGGLALEEGAARFNLGLVLAELGDGAGARAALERAAELLDPERVPAQASAAARELGAARLAAGDAAGARAALEHAVALADRAGDLAARGAAANGLGLALLADGRAEDAAAALRAAAADHPRSRRPDAFAMAKANLALALERGGRVAEARLAARQALGTPAAPAPVRAQAQEVLDRLGADVGDLRAALAAAPAGEAPALAREELVRSADADGEARVEDARAWLDALLQAPGDPADLAELWLGALLELPPEALERLARSTMQAVAELGDEDAETIRAAVSRATVRFHVPQWLRLQEVLSQAAEEAGAPGPWR